MNGLLRQSEIYKIIINRHQVDRSLHLGTTGKKKKERPIIWTHLGSKIELDNLGERYEVYDGRVCYKPHVTYYHNNGRSTDEYFTTVAELESRAIELKDIFGENFLVIKE